MSFRKRETERGSARWHSVETSLWKRLWTCRKTDWGMNKWLWINFYLINFDSCRKCCFSIPQSFEKLILQCTIKQDKTHTWIYRSIAVATCWGCRDIWVVYQRLIQFKEVILQSLLWEWSLDTQQAPCLTSHHCLSVRAWEVFKC
jgi:hypothetical protein